MPTNLLTVTGSPTRFAPIGATTPPNVELNVTGLAGTPVAKASKVWDRGAAAVSGWYAIEVRLKAQGAPAVGALVTVHVAESSAGTYYPGELAAEQSISTAVYDRLANVPVAVSVRCDEASAARYLINRGRAYLTGRYVLVVVANALAQALSATADDLEVTFTPIILQAQTP